MVPHTYILFAMKKLTLMADVHCTYHTFLVLSDAEKRGEGGEKNAIYVHNIIFCQWKKADEYNISCCCPFYYLL